MVGRLRGILGYCQHYWGGYFPLLLIRMADGNTPTLKRELVDKLEAIFSSCVHTSLPEDFTKAEEAGPDGLDAPPLPARVQAPLCRHWRSAREAGTENHLLAMSRAVWTRSATGNLFMTVHINS